MNRAALLRFLAGLAAGLVAGAEARDEAGKLQQLRGAIGVQEQQVRATNARRTALEEQIQKAETELARLHEHRASLGARMIATATELDALRKRRAALEQTATQQSQRLASEVAVAYRLGRSEPLKMLLNLEDPEQASRMMAYYGDFVAARAEELTRSRTTAQDLAAATTAIAARQTELESDRGALDDTLHQQQERQSERREAVAALARDMSDERARLEQLKTEERRLKDVLDRLARGGDGTVEGPFAKLAGRLPWPVAGKPLNRFGASRAGALPWTGWMIQTPEGSAVHAIHAGKVVFADYLRGHGQLIILDHGGGYLSLYAHNQTLLKATGTQVQGDEVIAHAGSSGGLEQSALYFEIRHGGKTLDPAAWLRKRD